MTFGELINGLEKNLGVELVDEGGAAAVDPGNGHLFLQKYNWLDRLGAEKAMMGLTKFADTMKLWRNILAGLRPSDAPSPTDDSSTPPSDDMLRMVPV